MPKDKKSIFFCQNCGHESTKWMGQCPGCHAWNTFVEELVTPKTAAKATNGSGSGLRKASAMPKKISEIDLDESNRTMIGIKELDRVLGGGIVGGSLVLIGGDPGIGKSTLLLQVCHKLTEQNIDVLYVSGEESLRQIKMRANRIGKFNDHLQLYCETNLDDIRSVIERQKPQTVIIDSIQTMYNENVTSSPGSVSQVRESTSVLLQIAKGLQIPVFIVGHVTKEGNVAGPRVLEHMVDTVLYFEGDRHASYRILRAVKNRFGSTNEIGVFEMCNDGLKEIANPSEYMLDGRPVDASGSVVACSMEGSRPIMIEIQSLVCHTNYSFPRRTANGTDFNRVNLLVAVLERRGRIKLSEQDVYVNITGGVRMTEPAVDLGIILAIASAAGDKTIDSKTVVFGEVGLSGEVRSVSMSAQRIKEAEKLGFERVILPASCMKALEKNTRSKIELVPVRNVRDAIEAIL